MRTMLIKEFIRFLKDNDAYIQYMSNLRKQKPTLFTKGFFNKDFEIKLGSYQSYIINYTLIWSITNEGWDFWEKIDERLKRYDAFKA